jgi:photosystem II stability/assembly factor-like uncharacterized protein
MATQTSTRIFAAAGHAAKQGFRGGVFRATADEGTWEELERGLPELVEAHAIVVHPRDPNVIYAGTQDGPYRSLDGGNSWERLGFPRGPGMVWSFAFHPTKPQVMYCGTAPVNLYRSDDNGDNWVKLPAAVSPEHCVMGFPTRTIGIAVDPSRPDDVYAGLEVSGVIRSSDGGDSWTDLSEALIDLSEKPHLKSRIGSDRESEGMLDTHAITVSSARPGAPILAVRMGLFRSSDRGETWRDMEIGRYSPLTYCRDVVVSPHDPRTLYACMSPAARSTDGSLYVSRDVGETWKRFDHGVKAEGTMMATAVHPTDADKVCCISRCGQVFATEDAGRSWREYRLPDDIGDAYKVVCC